MNKRVQDDQILSLVRGALLEIDDDTLSSSGAQARSVLDRVLTRVRQPSIDEATETEGIGAIPIGGHGNQHGHRRSLVAVAVAVAVAVFLTVGALALPSPGRPGSSGSRTAAGAGHGWRLVSDVTEGSWQESSLQSQGKVADFTCPTTTTCYFIDNLGDAPSASIEVTHDGGQTWQQSPVSGDNSFLGDIGCADADDCMLAGISSSSQMQFLATSNGGQSWSTTNNPDVPAMAELGGISCPSAGDCIAVGADASEQTSYAVATTDDGQTWTVSQMPSGFVPLSLDCPTLGNCVAGGFTPQSTGTQALYPTGGTKPASSLSPSGSLTRGVISYSSDGGSTWTLATLPADTGAGPAAGTSPSVVSISCADATDCAAATAGKLGGSPASQVLVSSDAGATWSQAPATGLPFMLTRQISCPSKADCWLGGISSNSPGTPSGVKETFASGLQAVLAMTADGGQAFQVSQLPQGVNGPVTALSCPSVTNCYALAVNLPEPPVKGSASDGSKSAGGSLPSKQVTKVMPPKGSHDLATLLLLSYSASSGS